MLLKIGFFFCSCNDEAISWVLNYWTRNKLLHSDACAGYFSAFSCLVYHLGSWRCMNCMMGRGCADLLTSDMRWMERRLNCIFIEQCTQIDIEYWNLKKEPALRYFIFINKFKNKSKKFASELSSIILFCSIF